MSTTARTMSGTSFYQRPGMEQRPVRVIDHDVDHGFCSVCGAVWPCSRARRQQMRTGDAATPW